MQILTLIEQKKWLKSYDSALTTAKETLYPYRDFALSFEDDIPPDWELNNEEEQSTKQYTTKKKVKDKQAINNTSTDSSTINNIQYWAKQLSNIHQLTTNTNSYTKAEEKTLNKFIEACQVDSTTALALTYDVTNSVSKTKIINQIKKINNQTEQFAINTLHNSQDNPILEKTDFRKLIEKQKEIYLTKEVNKIFTQNNSTIEKLTQYFTANNNQNITNTKLTNETTNAKTINETTDAKTINILQQLVMANSNANRDNNTKKEAATNNKSIYNEKGISLKQLNSKVNQLEKNVGTKTKNVSSIANKD